MDILAFRDAMLDAVIEQAEFGETCDFEWQNVEGNPSQAAAEAMLRYFSQNGLIDDFRPYHFGAFFKISARAHELKKIGGFKGRDELFKKNVEKLLLEIKKLEPNISDKIANFTTIANNIASFAGALMAQV